MTSHPVTRVRFVAYAVVLGAALTAGIVLNRMSRLANRPDSGDLVAESLDELILASRVASVRRIRITLGHEVFRVGVRPSREMEEFGGIGDGAIFTDGSALVSDALKLRLVLLGPSAENVEVIGRAGEGPGEFRELLSLYAGFGDRVYVLDNALFRLTSFDRVDGGLQLVKTARVSGNSSTACDWRGEYVSLEYTAANERILHLSSSDAGEAQAFGPPLRKVSHRLNFQLTLGRLICAPEVDAVFLAAETGDLVAIHPNGKPVWRVVIEDFEPTEITEIGEGVVRMTTAPPPENRSTSIGRFVRLNDSLAVLQLLVFERWNSKGKSVVGQTGVDTRIIDLRSGKQLGRQADLPEFLAIRGSHALVTADEPVPWVGMREFSLAAPLVDEQ